MNTPAFDQKAKPDLGKFMVEKTLPSKEELKRQIDQLIEDDYRGSRGLSFGIMIAVAIWIVTFGAIWYAWL